MSTFSPTIKPFERLHVTDGLLINADRWNLAHTYHRDRQNIHFQALHQAGVVWGLGVGVIPAPQEMSAQYRDGRWLQIQPGLAIDVFGNPIVVPQPIEFRISSVPLAGQTLQVYVTLSYVDPTDLQRSTAAEVVQETFRIDERQTPPTQEEVEVCRIVLQGEPLQLEASAQVFTPQPNQLDLRYRVQAQMRSQMQVRVGTPSNSTLSMNFDWLLRSLPGLYCTFQGERGDIGLETPATWQSYDLVAFTDEQARSLSDATLEGMRAYLDSGGVVFVEVATGSTELEGLLTMQQELIQEQHRLQFATGEALAIDESERNTLRRSLQTELGANQAAIHTRVRQGLQSIYQLADFLNISIQPWNGLEPDHPLRTQPFLFAAPPTLQYPIQVYSGGGFVVVAGYLSDVWGANSAIAPARDSIRTAQEFGVNLLHYASRRRQLTQLQTVPTQSQSTPA